MGSLLFGRKQPVSFVLPEAQDRQQTIDYYRQPSLGIYVNAYVRGERVRPFIDSLLFAAQLCSDQMEMPQ
jgi:hypothetical protein